MSASDVTEARYESPRDPSAPRNNEGIRVLNDLLGETARNYDRC
jgi:hypothetical protein